MPTFTPLYQSFKKGKDILFLEKFIKTNDSIQSKRIIFLTDSLSKPVIQIISPTQTHQSLFISHNLQMKDFETNLIRKGNENWIAMILLVCVIIFTYIRMNYRKRLSQVFKSFLSERNVNQLVREGNLFYEGISIPLFINYIFFLFLILFHYLLLLHFFFFSFLI